MKNLSIISTLFVFSLFLLPSCGDDSCETLSENIVGTWQAPLLSDGEFTFLEGGEFIDNDNILLVRDSEDAPFVSKSWLTSGDSQLLIRGMDEDGLSWELDLDVGTFECDMIDVSAQGLDVVFNRI